MKEELRKLIEARKRDLLALAKKRRLDVAEALQAAGDDDRRQMGILAMMLGIDARVALNLESPLPVHD